MSDDKFNFNFDLPEKSNVMPTILTPDTTINFRCHKGISCFNACCKHADITLTPYDIIRLKQRTGQTSEQFLKQYTVPFQMDADGLPGVKFRTTEDGACLFMKEGEGCTIYEDRPTSCRYYPLGNLAMKNAEQAHETQHFVLVQEEHCKGHEEDRPIKIQDYRNEQGLEDYDGFNKEFFQLILKKKSMGPGVGKPPEMSLQLFFMANYDMDRFRRFVLSDNFKRTYDLPQDIYDTLEADDVALMHFGFQLLRQVLFNEVTLPLFDGTLEKRVEERKEVIELRRKLEAEMAKAKDPYMTYKAEVEEESENLQKEAKKD